MSFKDVKQTIDEFILNDENNLLIIKGNWGVGKTYYWQNIIKEASEKKTIGKKRYAYVSLFGVDNLELLKETTLFSIVDSNNVHKSGTVSKIDKELGKVLSEITKTDFFKKYTGNVLNTIAFSALQDTLICFDDIERRSKSLTINHIFGLASLLKEQHNCKVVFILNDSKLEDSQAEFNIQREKLADYELEFAPLPEEVFDYIFDSSTTHYEFIKKCCLSLEIKNIRTLQKIKSFIKRISRHFKGKEKVATEVVIRSLILFVWAYYDKEDENVSLEVVKNHKLASVYVKERNKQEIKPEERKIDDLLNNYGRWFITEIDIPLISFVENGFLNTESFLKEFEDINKREIARKGNDDYRKAWDLYNQSFENNEEEFVEELVSGFNKNVEYIESHSLESSVSVLRDLGEDAKADSLIDKYIETHRSIFIPEYEQTIFYSSMKDAYLLQKIKKVIDSYEYNFEFNKTIEKIAFEKYSSYQEIKFLASHTTDDFIKYFKSVKSDNLYYYIKGCLQLGEFPDSQGYRQKIFSMTKEALETIASESKFNKVKISKWFEDYELDLTK